MQNTNISPLALFGAELQMRSRKICIERQPIERRWVEDMRQYLGQYEPEILSAIPAGRSRVFVNLTRAKTDKGEAQLVDMLFPVDDKNYGIAPTPVPELAELADSKEAYYDKSGNALQFADTKEVVTEGDAVKGLQEIAEQKAQAMLREIDDQLVECDYNSSCRRAIHYAAVLGTGVLCGPEVELREKSNWIQGEGGEYSAAFSVDKKPVVRHVPTWDFFPDLGASHIDECGFVFERAYLSRKSLKNMKRIPGVQKDAIDDLLRDNNPKSTQNFSEHVSVLREMSGIVSLVEDNRFEVWRYRGPVDKSVLAAAQVDIEKIADAQVDAIVIFCGDKVLKASINPMETEAWPYSVFCWDKDDNCIFGYGIPRAAKQPQSVINAAMRMMLDNASRSAGPQLIIDNRVEPQDGSYDLTPWKLWIKKDPSLSARAAFDSVEFPSRQNELANIYQLARALLDEETGLPMIAQGEQGQVTPTVGGMSMLMNAAGTVRRNQVKHFDDDVTVPIIKRFYDWNMQFNPKQEIKGDMKVYARGTSALLMKEQQSQLIFALIDKYAAHPIFGKMFKASGYDAMRKAMQSNHISADDILKSKEDFIAELEAEIKAAQESGQQQDPRMMVEEFRAQNKAQELQAQAAINDKNNQLQYEIARMRFQTELANLAQSKEISMAELEADLKKAGMKLDLDASMFKTELQLKQMSGLTANYGLDE